MSPQDLVRAEYDALPEAVKMQVSFLEYQWLSGADKAQLIQAATEPDILD